ncbi:MAG: hypothetical protein ACJASM_000196 [Salibacteraceae bacterium]|jgi:hypothetical protein
MLSMKTYDNQWISDVLTYVREDLGTGGRNINSRIVSEVRKKYASRDSYWTLKELNAPK